MLPQLTSYPNFQSCTCKLNLRIMGDDEIPITIDVSYDELSHGLEIWQVDAGVNASYGEFETALHKMLLKLSEGNIKR
jgi:hypothetical protein